MSDVPKIDSELFKVRNRATYHRNSMRGLSMSVLRSLMQKALRMGETDLAMRSAAEMDLSGNGKALFVRMKTVACEDFGVGSIGLLPFLFKQHELWNHTLGKGGRTSQSSTIKEARRILMSTVHAMCDKSQRLRRNRDAPMGSIVALSMLEDLKSPLECPLNTLPLISKHELVTKRLRKAILEEKIEILALQVVMMARVRGVEEQAMVTLQEIADERQRINSHDISGVAATIRCLCSLRSKKSDNRLFSAHAVQLLLLSEANRKLNMDPKMVMLSQSLVDSMYQRKIKMEEIPERVFDKHTGVKNRPDGLTGYQAFAKLGSACWNKMPDKWEKDGFAVYFARDKKNPKTSSGKYLEESLRVQYGEPTLAELALVEKKRKENRKKERKVTVKRKRRVSSKSSTSSKQQMTIRQLFAGRQMVKKSQLRDLEQESKRQKVSASKPSKPKPKSQKPKLSREEKMKLSLRKRRVVLRDTERVLQLPTSAHKKVVILMPPSTSPPSTSPPSSPSPNPQHRRRWIRKGPYKRNEVALQRLKFRHQALLQLSALVPHLHPITETDNMGRIWVWMEYIGESKPDSFRQLTARELLKPNVCVSAVEACAAKYALFHKEAGSSVVQGDLVCRNLLVSENNRVYILDLEDARTKDPNPQETELMSLLFTKKPAAKFCDWFCAGIRANSMEVLLALDALIVKSANVSGISTQRLQTVHSKIKAFV